MVCPESLRTPTIAPTSVGGKINPVDAELVVMVFQTADSWSASAIVLPSATRPVAPSPQMLVVESGEFPEAKTRDGIAILSLLKSLIRKIENAFRLTANL